jgi:hypothetical protein
MARKHTKRSLRRHRKGGAGAPDPSTYSSAATYGLAVNGSGDTQYNNVFSQSGPDAQFPSNQSIGLQGQNLGYPASATMQKAGAKRKGKSKKGGFWGQILNQAVVPFSILGLQQTYRSKKQSRKNGLKTRKNRK